MRHGFTSHGFFLGLRCGVPPRQTQTDNDASGSPQRVAGRQPPLSVLAATLHFPLVSAWWAKKAFRTSPTISHIGDVNAQFCNTQKKTRPSALCVGAVPKGGPPRINDDTHNRYMRHGFANCELRPAVCEWCFLCIAFYGIPTTGRQPPLSVLVATLHFPLVSAWWAKKAFRTSPTKMVRWTAR